MRHRKTGVKLGRTSSHRDAMFRNMVTSLLKYDRIRTTDVKAKELRRWVDKIITLAKRGDLHARRQALSIVREKDVVHKLFEEAPKRFSSTNGGYARIVKIGRRSGDAAPMSLIELISVEEKSPKTKKKKAKAPKKARPTVSEKKPEAKAETPEPAAEEPEAEVSQAESKEAESADDAGTEEAAVEEPGDKREAPEEETAEAEEAPAADEEENSAKK